MNIKPTLTQTILTTLKPVTNTTKGITQEITQAVAIIELEETISIMLYEV